MFVRFSKNAPMRKKGETSYVRMAFMDYSATAQVGDKCVCFGYMQESNDEQHLYTILTTTMDIIPRFKCFIGSAERWDNINHNKRRKYEVKLVSKITPKMYCEIEYLEQD